MRVIISVVGKNEVGILAKISSHCSKYNADIVEVSQTVLKDIFTMIMICEFNGNLVEFINYIEKEEKNSNLKINVMHEDIFNSMHKI